MRLYNADGDSITVPPDRIAYMERVGWSRFVNEQVDRTMDRRGRKRKQREDDDGDASRD